MNKQEFLRKVSEVSNLNFMTNAYYMWKELAQIGLDIGQQTPLKEISEPYLDNLERIVVLGLGGSGIIGDYLRTLSLHYDFPVEIIVTKSFTIKEKINEKTLVIAISYSGETLETLKAIHNLRERPLSFIGVTSGNALEEILLKEKATIIKIPGGYPSRVAFPLMFYSLLTYLSTKGLTGRLKTNEIISSIKVLEDPVEVSGRALEIARSINKDKVFLTSHYEYLPIAIRLKNDLSENAKIFATVEELPEWFHNTLEGISINDWDILLVEGKLTDYYKCYTEAIERVLEKKLLRLVLRGNTLLDELIYGTWLSGFLSLEIAIKRNVDPRKTYRLSRYRDITKISCS